MISGSDEHGWFALREGFPRWVGGSDPWEAAARSVRAERRGLGITRSRAARLAVDRCGLPEAVESIKALGRAAAGAGLAFEGFGGACRACEGTGV